MSLTITGEKAVVTLNNILIKSLDKTVYTHSRQRKHMPLKVFSIELYFQIIISHPVVLLRPPHWSSIFAISLRILGTSIAAT